MFLRQGTLAAVRLYVIVLLVTPAWSQSLYSPASACCGMKLMDATQQVAIETGRALSAGQYRAVSLRACATDTVFVQIWTRVNDSSYQLKWQTNVTPTTAQLTQNYFTAAFEANNLPTVTSNDRLGLYGVVSPSGTYKLDVPYDVIESGGSLHFTQSRYDNPATFVAGLRVTIEDLSWPRSLASYVKFCTRADCSDVSSDSPAVSTTTSRPSSLPFCGCPTSCSPDAAMSDSMDAQARSIQVLQDEMNKLTDLVNSLSSSNVQTGYCPENFVPGVYGIGSCYKVYRNLVQLGVAAIRCSVDHAANLLDIDSDVEQRFIYSLITNNGSSNTGVEKFWMSGMYNLWTQMWTWYHQDGTPRATIKSSMFNAWPNNNEPIPSSELDICLVVAVNSTSQTSYWQESMCISESYYICEVPKMCY